MSNSYFFSAAFIEDVRSLDPLNCDKYCESLPHMNLHKDISGITSILRNITPCIDDVLQYSPAQCFAVLRDLGIFIGSLRRHGVQFSDVSDSLDAVLIALGKSTDMIPRDTILHYTLFNPRDERMRIYTPDVQEFHLQESVVMVCDNTNNCLELLEGLVNVSEINEIWVSSLAKIDDLIRIYEKSMLYVQENVSPKYFIDELRPYLDEVVIGGAEYLGPAAAQLPMWLFDVILWGGRSEGYLKFWKPLVPYSPKSWRDIYQKWINKPSIAEMLITRLSEGQVDTNVTDSAQHLVSILGSIFKFRSMHLGIAKKSYKSSDKYTIGSAGGSIDLLRDLIDITGDFKSKVYRNAQEIDQLVSG